MSRRFDAHQHFWKYCSDQYPWIPPGTPLQKDLLPSDLEKLQEPLGLRGSIAVQARQSLEETRWLLELADRNPSILGVVGWVDLRSPKVGEQLSVFARNPKLVGVRHVAQDEPDDRFLVGSEFLRGIEVLSGFGLRYDLLIFPQQLPAAIELVHQFPGQPFVLDHCAKPRIAAGEMEPWSELLVRLASHENVWCKVSGLVTEAEHALWSPEALLPYLSAVEAAFGRKRLMWGSDWPVCLLASAYERWFEVATEWTEGWSREDRDGFFGANAARFYGVDSGSTVEARTDR
jgi:L-fuconolactonase